MMPSTTIQTSRTILRPFTLQDAAAAYIWFGNPQVMRYTPHGADASLAETQASIALYSAHQAHYGFAKWLVLDKCSGNAIGDAGPMYFPEIQNFELGYRLLPEYWQQGLATEIATAWVQHCQYQFALKTLIGFTHPENRASIRVLNKVGFQFSHAAELMGMSSKVFKLELA